MSLDHSSTICVLNARRHATECWTRSALIALLSLAVAQPAWAQTTNPNPPPIPPPSVTFPQTSTLDAAQCAQQLTNAINTANNAGLGANATATAAQVVGLTAQELASATSAAAFGAMSAGLGATVTYGIALSGLSAMICLHAARWNAERAEHGVLEDAHVNPY
jgi:hypothetical protein